MRLETWMMSCAEAMGWGFWNLKKNSVLRFGLGRSKSIFGARRGQTSSLRWGATVVGSDGKVSPERNCVSLSSCWKTLNSKKLIKVLYLNQFRVFQIPVYEHLWTFSVSVWICLFHEFVSWSYIFGRGYATKAPFSIATTLRCRGRRYSFLWNALLYL